jgi:ABC-type lipoprotein export system ATPase subunit
MTQVVPHANVVPLPIPSGRPILRATGLRKNFRMGDSVVEVLKDVDLAIRSGEFIAIEGRSGSGKSTLLHVLGALDVGDGGAVEFEGQSYGTEPPNQWVARLRDRWTIVAFIVPLVILEAVIAIGARTAHWSYIVIAVAQLLAIQIIAGLPLLVVYLRGTTGARFRSQLRVRSFGFVFQFYHLLPELNVLENALLGPMVEHSWLGFRSQRRQLRERAVALLNELGLGHRLTHRPNQLSGGERQRVAIARALMNEPKVLFADEPTGNLDADTGKQIMGVLERLHREKGQTIVMVTHDRSLARKTDRVLVLKHGKLEPAEG